MKTLNFKPSSIILAAAAILLLAFSACNEDGPFTPLAEAQPGVTENADKVIETNVGSYKVLRVDPAYRAPSLSKDGDSIFVAEQYIDAAWGGWIMLGSHDFGFSALAFSPNALPHSDTIYFEWAASNCFDGMLTGLEFGPHGTQFQTPVYLSLSYRAADLTGINEDDLKFFYFNDLTGIWELTPCKVNKWTKTVVVKLNHFSRYALSHS